MSEVLARLIDPGDTVVDAGANVGYMTVLAAAAAGPTGRVVAFEPHPEWQVLRMWYRPTPEQIAPHYAKRPPGRDGYRTVGAARPVLDDPDLWT